MYVLDIVREHFTRRQAMDASSRNLIRLMTVTAGYPEIRAMAGQRLEIWLQNPKVCGYCSVLELMSCFSSGTVERLKRTSIMEEYVVI